MKTMKLPLQKIRYIVFLLPVLLAMTSCYYDNQEALFPQTNSTCDTTSVTFSGSVVPILKNHCYLCHSNVNAPSFGGNFKLEDYTDVKYVANANLLLPAIEQNSTYLPPMPKSGSKLDDCSIATIKKWVNSGTPNN